MCHAAIEYRPFMFGMVFGLAMWGTFSLWTAAEEQPAAKPVAAALDWTGKNGAGKLVSFQHGALTVRRLDATLLRWAKLPAKTKFVHYDHAAEKFTPLEVDKPFQNAKPGTWIQVYLTPGVPTAKIGEEDRKIRGHFISFKDERLLIQSKDFNLKYFRRYGTTVHLRKFKDDLRAYESIDGGDYKLVGTANEVLPRIKEGTVITLHDEGEGNFTWVDIGLKKM